MLRFPHLAEQTLQKLDNEGLAKSREVEQFWQTFIDKRDYPWLRIVNIPTLLANGNTYLHLAAERGQINVFEMKFNGQDKIIQKNNFACSKGGMSIVSMSLKKSLEVTIDLNRRNKSGLTPFHLACKYGHSEIAEMLMNNPFHPKIYLNIKDSLGTTAFHHACMEGHSKIAKIIIENSSKLKIDLSAKDNGDSTAFWLACYHGQVEIANMMLNNSSRIEMDWDGKNICGTTAFISVCGQGHLKLAEMMINNSVSLKIDLNNKTSCNEKTAFHFACSGGKSAIVEMLIERSECHKIDLTAKDRFGRNGYQMAEKWKNTEVINLIKFEKPSLVVQGVQTRFEPKKMLIRPSKMHF